VEHGYPATRRIRWRRAALCGVNYFARAADLIVAAHRADGTGAVALLTNLWNGGVTLSVSCLRFAWRSPP